ncbi:MAG: UvrD-helicase domain-containing protein [Bacteroidales bacterium]|nr:UvrD-helicase domain-containing protein [Bacteroidales bacterium]
MQLIDLNSLNESQRNAVEYCDGVSLVIAGAGSGKTRVLTHKIAYLLSMGYSPYSILALTFTNKAAAEMKSRIASMVGVDVASRIWAGTFHSIFLRILRPYANRLGFPTDFTIYDSSDSRSLITSIIKEMKLDDKVYKPRSIASIISKAKNALITPNSYASNREIVEDDYRAKRPATKDIYRAYCERCHRAGAMDFDDILLYTNILFRDHPDIVEHYGEVFRYVLVDEYQDINFAQHLIVKQIVKHCKRLCVVGDDAQSIYSFRGANISNILNLQHEYSGCRIFKLEQNYRSTQMIVNVANSLIEKNKGQIPKHIFSENESGDRVKLVKSYSDYEEAYMVAGSISEVHLRYGNSYNEFAILYRTNAQSRIFEEALRKRNIPYRIYGGISFYQRKEIKDVIAYIRMVLNPADEEALKRIINYPARGIGDTTLKKIIDAAMLHTQTLWGVLSNPLEYGVKINSGTQTKLKTFTTLIDGLREDVKEQDAATFVQNLIKKTGIFADVYVDNLPENVSKQENLQELINSVVEFCDNQQESGESATINDFLSQVSLATDQDNGDEGDIEKVTLMTVHAAKGLEFTNIYIVGLEENLFPSSMSLETQSEIEEERRLLYVAITRAEKRCTLSYASSRYRNGQTTASPPSRFIKDLDFRFINDTTGASQAGECVASQPQQQTSYSANRWQTQSRVSQSNSLYGEPKQNLRSMRTAIYTPSPKTDVASKTNDATLQEGTRISHDRFGEGVVLSVSGVGDNRKIEVEFKNVGRKTLLLKFARYTII